MKSIRKTPEKAKASLLRLGGRQTTTKALENGGTAVYVEDEVDILDLHRGLPTSPVNEVHLEQACAVKKGAVCSVHQMSCITATGQPSRRFVQWFARWFALPSVPLLEGMSGLRKSHTAVWNKALDSDAATAV